MYVTAFAVTFLTTTWFGGGWAGFPPQYPINTVGQYVVYRLTEGLKFSIPLLLIVGLHEAGHYLAARRYGLMVDPPLFIPVPLGIGTFGAVIRIREPLWSPEQLVDVGAAGPIAGFITTLPFLVVGMKLSKVVEPAATAGGGMIQLGEPLILKLVAWLLHPGIGSDQEILLHPTAFAAWFGLFLTALNLLPLGQLDGGHVAYAALGGTHRRIAVVAWLLLFILGFGWMGWWVWAVVALVMGVVHPRIPLEGFPLDKRRKLKALACLVIFILCFMPEPFKITG